MHALVKAAAMQTPKKGSHYLSAPYGGLSDHPASSHALSMGSASLVANPDLTQQ